LERRLNVNKEKAVIRTSFYRVIVAGIGAASLVLTSSACSGSAYEYDISGVVQSGQIDYDCPRHLSMEDMGFITGSGDGKSPSKRSSSSSSSRRSKSTKKADRAGPEVRVKSSPKSGARLSKKPDKPQRITGIPKPRYVKKPRGCAVDDYELYILNGDDLYEQDVRRVDYDKCLDTKHEHFPRCTND
jgi:hypothetical protein